MSSRWLKRVASSLFLLGLVVAIVILLLPGEHEITRFPRISNKTFDNSHDKNGGPQRLNMSAAGKGMLGNTAPL